MSCKGLLYLQRTRSTNVLNMITIRRFDQKPLFAAQANTMVALEETVNDRFCQPFQTVTYLYILLLISEIICCSGKHNRGH